MIKAMLDCQSKTDEKRMGWEIVTMRTVAQCVLTVLRLLRTKLNLHVLNVFKVVVMKTFH